MLPQYRLPRSQRLHNTTWARQRAHRNRRPAGSTRTSATTEDMLDGRVQRATLLWHRLHRHGVGRGAVIKLASSQTAAASTFFGMSDVVSPARSLRRQPIPGNSHDLPQPPRATSLGRPAGRPRLVNTPVDGISQTASLKSAQNEPNYKTATSPANNGGS